MTPNLLLTEVFVSGRSRTKGSWNVYSGRAVGSDEMTDWQGYVATMVSAERHRRLGTVDARPHHGPVEVTLSFFLPRPKTGYADPIGHQTGDLDKLTRLIFDALKTGGLYTDDSVATVAKIGKFWATPEVPMGVHVIARTAPDGHRAEAELFALDCLARQGEQEDTGY